MCRKQRNDELAKEITCISDNIRAEVLVARILETGASSSDIQVESVGNFTRPYSKDIIEAAAIDWYKKSILRIKLSRNGIYDLLPEGVTHTQQIIEGEDEEVRALSKGYRLRKTEEAACRKFFKPFEQEFFMQCVNLELKEHEMLLNSSAVFHSFLREFWNLPANLLQKYEVILLRILPFIHEIAGNYDKIQTCLKEILNLPVSYEIEFRTINVDSKCNKLGGALLGRTFTVGSCVYGIPYSIFNIGPIPTEQLQSFLPEGEIDEFLKIFFRYTIPLESDLVINLVVDKSVGRDRAFQFGILGYSTTL